MKPLAERERVEVIRRGLKQAREKDGRETKITSDAESLIAMYSEGYPHFIQGFAYCAFEEDRDWIIDQKDVERGAWGEHGAFAQLGTKYFEGMYFDQIASDAYRQVLRVMANHLDDWVSREQIRQQSNLKPTTLDNAIRALTKRQIILPQPGQRGMYRLPLKSFAVWIKAYTNFPGEPITTLGDLG